MPIFNHIGFSQYYFGIMFGFSKIPEFQILLFPLKDHLRGGGIAVFFLNYVTPKLQGN